jgi:hypothetical protein
MAAKFTVYTAEAIVKIRTMKAAGKKSPEIARAIGTTTNSLTARMSQLGIKGQAARRYRRLETKTPSRRRTVTAGIASMTDHDDDPQ